MNLLDRFINIDGNATYEVAKRDYKLKVPGNLILLTMLWMNMPVCARKRELWFGAMTKMKSIFSLLRRFPMIRRELRSFS